MKDISIITVCYNSEKTIRDTIESVLDQKNCSIEYIIIDGGSKDNTMNIVREYEDKIDVIVSEKDNGIFDAMNKGIALATSPVVGILNSDDYYLHDTVLADVVQVCADDSIDACYGNIIYVEKDNKDKRVRYWKAGDYKKEKLFGGWVPPHPAFFLKKTVYDQFGVFRTDFKIAADYELMLRLLLKKEISMHYIDKDLVAMRTGGNSGTFFQRFAGWKEIRRAWKVNGLHPPAGLIFLRVLKKIPQYFLRGK